jgi:hypothetical protein
VSLPAGAEEPPNRLDCPPVGAVLPNNPPPAVLVVVLPPKSDVDADEFAAPAPNYEVPAPPVDGALAYCPNKLVDIFIINYIKCRQILLLLLCLV